MSYILEFCKKWAAAATEDVSAKILLFHAVAAVNFLFFQFFVFSIFCVFNFRSFDKIFPSFLHALLNKRTTI